MSRDNRNVFCHPGRRFVTLSLALGRSPTYIARRVKIGRKQVIHHRNQCLGGNPLRADAEELGYRLVEEEAS